ncbi:MAG: prepilin-type N-terminal cleavage/methylation domain-containing protein [Phycisphaerales bacterium]|nr:prepilin-type N-terminal cleavage/methylation domain-containing protein [Phycisphaerales bacterium]
MTPRQVQIERGCPALVLPVAEGWRRRIGRACNGANAAEKSAFTLIEMLVVIGIIVLLVGLTFPIVIGSRGKAEIAKVRMTMQMISTALEQYRHELGDYPRFMDSGAGDYRGAILLARALVGPGPKDGGNSLGQDGADGPGFRARRVGDPETGQAVGQVYGPYLKADALQISSNPANPDAGITDPTQPMLFDAIPSVVLYFPARRSKPDLTNIDAYVNSNNQALYNQQDNTILPLADMRRLLAGTSGNERKYTGPFLLWSAGPDGTFGTSDDITNFNE